MGETRDQKSLERERTPNRNQTACPIRWIASDIDGTLLDPEIGLCENLVQRFQESLRALKQRDPQLGFSLVSGRPSFAIYKYAEKLGLSTPILACNGAILEDQGRRVFEESFDITGIWHFLEAVAQDGHTVLLYAGDTEYCLQETEWVQLRRAKGAAYPVFDREALGRLGKQIIKVNLFAKPEDDRGISDYLGILERLEDQFSIAYYGILGCEIVSVQANKGQGVFHLAKYLNLKPEEILVIGDNSNDIPMFQRAKYSVAVNNASDALKEQASYVAQGRAIYGVIEAMDLIRQGFCFE